MSHRFPEQEHIGRRMREEPERVQALREWEHALHGKKTIAGLESGNATKGSWPQPRPLGLSSESERYHPCRDGRWRPARASARRVLQIPRLARCGGRAIC